MMKQELKGFKELYCGKAFTAEYYGFGPFTKDRPSNSKHL